MNIEAAELKQLSSSPDERIPSSDYQLVTADGEIYVLSVTTKEGLERIGQLKRIEPGEYDDNCLIVGDPDDIDEVKETLHEIAENTPEELSRLLVKQEF